MKASDQPVAQIPGGSVEDAKKGRVDEGAMKDGFGRQRIKSPFVEGERRPVREHRCRIGEPMDLWVGLVDHS